MFICFIKFVKKVMVNKLKNAAKLLLTLLLLASFMANYACTAQKHHKAVPCPCEKRNNIR